MGWGKRGKGERLALERTPWREVSLTLASPPFRLHAGADGRALPGGSPDAGPQNPASSASSGAPHPEALPLPIPTQGIPRIRPLAMFRDRA